MSILMGMTLNDWVFKKLIFLKNKNKNKNKNINNSNVKIKKNRKLKIGNHWTNKILEKLSKII